MVTDEESFYGSFAMHFHIQKYCHDWRHHFTWNIWFWIVEHWMSGSQLLEWSSYYSSRWAIGIKLPGDNRVFIDFWIHIVVCLFFYFMTNYLDLVMLLQSDIIFLLSSYYQSHSIVFITGFSSLVTVFICSLLPFLVFFFFFFLSLSDFLSGFLSMLLWLCWLHWFITSLRLIHWF